MSGFIIVDLNISDFHVIWPILSFAFLPKQLAVESAFNQLSLSGVIVVFLNFCIFKILGHFCACFPLVTLFLTELTGKFLKKVLFKGGGWYLQIELTESYPKMVELLHLDFSFFKYGKFCKISEAQTLFQMSILCLFSAQNPVFDQARWHFFVNVTL